MTDKYILNEKHDPVPCNDLLEWGKWFETADRHVAHDEVGDQCISTVFLGLDHAWGNGPPLLFETMIFGGPNDGYQDRCSTWDQALKQHAEAVALNRSELAAGSDYDCHLVENSGPFGPGKDLIFRIKGHNREQTCWALVAKMAAYAFPNGK